MTTPPVDRRPFEKSRDELIAAVRASGAPAYVVNPLCAQVIAAHDAAMTLLETSHRIDQQALEGSRETYASLREIAFVDAYPPEGATVQRSQDGRPDWLKDVVSTYTEPKKP